MKKHHLFLFIIFSAALVGCKKDIIIDDPIVEIDNGVQNLANYEVNEEKVFVWQPEDYQTATDVIIESADTTVISISKSFYEKQVNALNNESVLNITLAEDELPFIRKVTSIAPQGDRYVMQTIQATLEDIFKNLNVELSNTPYYSEANVSRSGDPAAGLIDENGVYHPSKYIITYPDGTKTVIDARQATRLEASNWRQNLSWDLNNLEFNLSTADWYNLHILFNGQFLAQCNIGVVIIFNNLNSFTAHLSVETRVDASMVLAVQTDLLKWIEAERDLFSGPSIGAVIPVGVIPVSIKMVPRIVLFTDLSARGYVETGFGYTYTSQNLTGFHYMIGNGFTPIRGSSSQMTEKPITVTAGVEAKADIGLYAKLSLEICESEIGYGRIGPYIDGHVGAQVDLMTKVATINYNSKWGVGGKIGAHLRIANNDIAAWEYPFETMPPTTLSDYERQIQL